MRSATSRSRDRENRDATSVSESTPDWPDPDSWPAVATALDRVGLADMAAPRLLP